MSRRIDIELTSAREDGTWTWRAAGAREPKGTLEGTLLPPSARVGDQLRAEVEGFLDGLTIVAVTAPKAERAKADLLELRSSGGTDEPLVTTTLSRRPRSDSGSPRRPDRTRGGRRDAVRDGREGREGRERRPSRGGPDRRDGREGRERARREREVRPTAPPADAKPKPKRLRPGRTHRTALLESVPAEQRPIAEQLLQGGIPSVRQAIEKQNAELKSEGKPEVKADALLRVAEDLRPKATAALWRDRAEAAVAAIDDLDLRDLRSVVNAAGDAGRDQEARALAAQLRDALTDRVEKEHAAWLAELADNVHAGRVVRALRLSSRPPKAGSPIPGDLSNQLAAATAAALTSETGQERWATVLDALAFSPIRRRVVPHSLPAKVSLELRTTIARVGTRLPDIAHIFDVEPDESAGRPRPVRRGESRRSARDAKGKAKAADSETNNSTREAEAAERNANDTKDANGQTAQRLRGARTGPTLPRPR